VVRDFVRRNHGGDVDFSRAQIIAAQISTKSMSDHPIFVATALWAVLCRKDSTDKHRNDFRAQGDGP
jgi:hypothetical protein